MSDTNTIKTPARKLFSILAAQFRYLLRQNLSDITPSYRRSQILSQSMITLVGQEEEAHRGHEMWKVAPMGLANSVAHVQKYMDNLLSLYMWKCVAVYIADILVFSATFESQGKWQANDLKQRFGHLHEQTIRHAKCSY